MAKTVRIFTHVSNILRPTRREALNWLILLGAVLLVPVLTLLPRFTVAELRAYDRALGLLPAPRADERIRIVGIDDRAIDLIGEWPWSRSELERGLAVIAEFAPAGILLDIELSEASPLTADRAQLDAAIDAFPDAIPRPIIDELLVDRDVSLAQTLAAIGSVSLPVTVEDRPGVAVGLRPALPALRRGAANEGFSNLQIDRDGVSRRVDLVRRVTGDQIPQLALAFGGFRIAADETAYDDDGRLALSESLFPTVTVSRSEETVMVPVDHRGQMLVRWPETAFADSYPQLSWASLIEYRTAIEDLRFNVALMENAGLLDARSQSVVQVADAAEELLETARESGDPALFPEYRRLRQAFVALAGGLLQGGTEARVRAELDALIDSAPQAERGELEAIRGEIEMLFAATREIYGEVERLRQFLETNLAGSYALVGYTATSTIDLGVTPFDGSVPNLGLHAAVLSMMRHGDFVRAVPWWMSWVLGAVWATFAVLVLRRSSGRRSLILAVAAIVIPLAAQTALLLAVRAYLPLYALVIPVVTAALAMVTRDYLEALRDRQVIRTTFEHYLAPEIISELIADPESVAVGGREAHLTALFTDIAGFSRVSEILGTSEIVSLLNEYLTEMSDVVLNHHGTIDKYEGDAIMAFFGAPVASANHAESAARAAIQMKRVERLLNDRLVRGGASPVPLVTRIGINSGEMIVGNLGTTRRLNYTVMGPAVNLAARLEGVNKVYGTAICVSEFTHAELPQGFLTRRMDRVRVQGIDGPVRLYELIGYQEEASAPLREALELFDRGLAAFETHDWEAAQARFETVMRIYPDDGPARLFAQRCEKFRAEPPRDTWDGVIALSQK